MLIWVVSSVELLLSFYKYSWNCFWCTVECCISIEFPVFRRSTLRDSPDARVTDPITGAALIILFEAELGLGFTHPSLQLCCCSSEPPPPPPAAQALFTVFISVIWLVWPLSSDCLLALMDWWHSLGPDYSCSCLAFLVSPAHVYHLWLKHSCAVSCPLHSCLVFDVLEELAHPNNCGSCHSHTEDWRAKRLRAQAGKLDFLGAYSGCHLPAV